MAKIFNIRSSILKEQKAQDLQSQHPPPLGTIDGAVREQAPGGSRRADEIPSDDDEYESERDISTFLANIGSQQHHKSPPPRRANEAPSNDDEYEPERDISASLATNGPQQRHISPSPLFRSQVGGTDQAGQGAKAPDAL